MQDKFRPPDDTGFRQSAFFWFRRGADFISISFYCLSFPDFCRLHIVSQQNVFNRYDRLFKVFVIFDKCNEGESFLYLYKQNLHKNLLTPIILTNAMKFEKKHASIQVAAYTAYYVISDLIATLTEHVCLSFHLFV